MRTGHSTGVRGRVGGGSSERWFAMMSYSRGDTRLLTDWAVNVVYGQRGCRVRCDANPRSFVMRMIVCSPGKGEAMMMGGEQEASEVRH